MKDDPRLVAHFSVLELLMYGQYFVGKGLRVDLSTLRARIVVFCSHVYLCSV